MKTFEYRLYPNKEQQRKLMECLIDSRIVYNKMLEVAKKQFKLTGTFPTRYDFNLVFKGKYEHIPATTIQMLSYRLINACKSFMKSEKTNIKVGFPHFKNPNEWHSIQLRQYGVERDFRLDKDKKHLIIAAKLGKSIKIRLHRPFEGTPKTAHLVLRADGHWYVLIVCDMIPVKEHTFTQCSHESIGIDVGLKSFLTDSNGNMIDNPRYYRKSEETLGRKQRIMCRRTKGSKGYQKAARGVALTHLKISRQRKDFNFKIAKEYAEKYSLIAAEKLNISGMIKNHRFAKSINDASWASFLDTLTYRSEDAGHKVVRINPRFTSQKCNSCGEIVRKTLSVRTHICPFCGYIADRDVNAAKNILMLGKQLYL